MGKEGNSDAGVLSRMLQVFLALFAFVLYVGVAPFFLLLMTPLYLARAVVSLIAKICKPQLLYMVSPRDGVVGLDDVTVRSECMIQVTLTFHGNPDVNVIRQAVQNKLICQKGYEKFQYFYENFLGFCFWKKEQKFSIEKHVLLAQDANLTVLANNAESNNNNNNGGKGEIISEDTLMACLSELSTRAFPAGQSPWEIIIFPNYKPNSPKFHTNFIPKMDTSKMPENASGERFVLLLRVHHAISDGYSIMKLIMSNLSDRTDVPQANVSCGGVGATLLRWLAALALSPYFHLKQFFIDVDRNLWHLKKNRHCRQRWLICSEKISLTALKATAKSMKVSTTAVLLAAYGGAIRRYLQMKGKGGKVPEVMRALAPMPWIGHPMDGLVNHWTLGFLVVPVGAEGVKCRAQIAQSSVDTLKRSPVLLTNFATVPLLLGAPKFLTDIWATNWMTTLVLSNFAGPDFMVQSFDNAYWMEDVIFWLPNMRGTATMGVAFLSTNGGIRVTGCLDKAIIPTQKDASLLQSLINEEFKLIQQLQDPIV